LYNTVKLYLVWRADSYSEYTVDNGILYTVDTVHTCTATCLVWCMCRHYFYSRNCIVEFLSLFEPANYFKHFFSLLVKFNTITVYVSFVCSTVESLSLLMASSPSSACDWCRVRKKLEFHLAFGTSSSQIIFAIGNY